MSCDSNKEEVSGYKQVIRYIVLVVIPLIINAFIINIVMEYIWRQDTQAVIGWVKNSGRAFREAIYIILVIELIIYLISNSTAITAIIVNLLGVMASTINYLKLSMKGEVFTLADVGLVREALGVAGKFEVRFNTIFWTAILVVIATSICIALINKKIPAKKLNRFIMLGIGIVLIFLLKPYCIMINNDLGYTGTVFEPELKYTENGIIPGLVVTLTKEVKKPEGYSKNAIQTIYDANNIGADNHTIKPNVICIMNESLFDITSIGDIELSEDPLSKFKQYQNEFLSGNLLSPSYAGGTAQVEYEVLTGYPGYKLSGTAYTEYIKKEMDTLVSLYEARGYETYAFHPHTKTFYNRNKVYNLFGFNHVYFKDDMELGLEYTGGGWATDEALYKNALNILECRQSDKPIFVFIVTTQNHGGHAWKYTGEKNVKVISSLPADEKMATETYVNLVYGADKALDEFIQSISKWNGHNMITVFGDHAPDLRQYGIDIDNKYIETHRTPLLVWNNYNMQSGNIGDVAAYRLGAYVAKLSGINSDLYINMLADKQSPNIIENRLITNDEQVILRDSWDSEIFKIENDRWMLQYDRMFGKNYYKEIEHEQAK